MKILFAALILFLTSCNNVSNDSKTTFNGRTWNIKFEDSLGNIQIVLPNQLDTLYRWREHSDCGDPCNQSDYRIQPKALPFFKDNGFYYFPLKDSVEQFTIKHPKIVRRKGMNDSLFTQYESSILQYLRQRFKSELSYKTNKKIITDTIVSVNKK
jgi:hypothetical protein